MVKHSFVGTRIFLASLTSIMGTPAYSASPRPQPLPALTPAIDTFIEKAMREKQVPGIAVAVVSADRVLAIRGYGIRQSGRPEHVDGDTLFNIASLTKSFTAAAAAVLVDEGRLHWDDPVRRWRPDVQLGDPWVSREVTLRDLLSHRTGIDAGDTSWLFTGFDRAGVIRRLGYMKPQAPFRTRQVYANSLYTLGGEVAAAAAGSSWEELVRSRLLRPLRLSATGFGPPLGPNVASPHAILGGKLRPIRQVDYTNIGPAGGLHSSARDMATWLRFQLGRGMLDGRRYISEEAMDEMHEPQILIPTTPRMRAARQVDFFAAYGLGWTIMDYRGHPMFWHSGSAEGMPTYMAVLPKDDLAIVVLTNSWEASLLRGEIAGKIFDHLLRLAPTPESPPSPAITVAASPKPPATMARRPSLPFAVYSGTYRNDLYGDILVTLAGSVPSLQIGRGQTARIEPIGGDSFRVIWNDPVYAETYPSTATFRIDPSGKATGLLLALGDEDVEAARLP
jgi:CubicO group peptidase (beta-lactamase class C family)